MNKETTTQKEIITKAMNILRSVERKSNFDMTLMWEMEGGFDADFDKKMKGYFGTIRPVAETELHKAMADIWNATIEFYYTEPKNEECEIEQALSEAKRIQRSATIEDVKRGVEKIEVVSTPKGQKALITFKDGGKILRKLYEAPKKEDMLNFDACEKELIDLAEFGSHDYRSALAALVAKYRA